MIRRWLARAALVATGLAALPSCAQRDEEPAAPAPGRTQGPTPPAVPSPAGAQRLTRAQYANAIHDVFGADVVVPPALEPDSYVEGFAAIGASLSAVSPRGIEQYEKAAFDVAKQALADDAHRARLVPCAPAQTVDAECAKKAITALGRSLWRRPLTDAEIATVSGIATDAAGKVGDFWQGLQFAYAELLQSPWFLFRPNLGEPDPQHEGQRRWTAWEMASRLSFFLWNTTPDEELLTSAESGEILTESGLAEQVDRLLADPRARQGLRSFVTEWLGLADLDSLEKDSTLFTTFDPSVGPDAREETLRVFEHLVFDLDQDLRDVLTIDWTYVNPRLAAIYAVPSPSPTGFSLVTLPHEVGRRGLLGQIAFLALQAHPTMSSSTLRGRFVRTRLLCGSIDPPPVGVNTALPEATGNARTRRDRMNEHLTNPVCAGCHNKMEPIGLGLENFDSMGAWRTKDNGAPIDASGELDGTPFVGPLELAAALHDHPKLGRCIARNVFKYATSFADDADDIPVVDALGEDFRAAGYSMKSLLRAVAMSPGFRLARTPQ